MSDDIRKAIAGLAESQKQIMALAHEAKIESIVLQAVCAALAAEIANLDSEPKQRLTAILAGIDGSVMAAASSTNSPPATEAINRIITLAENLIPSE